MVEGQSRRAHGEAPQPQPPACGRHRPHTAAHAEPAGIGAQRGRPTHTAPAGHRAGHEVKKDPQAW